MRSYTHSLRECTVELSNGDFCGAKPRPGLPFKICTRHAIQLYAAMNDETNRLAQEQGYIHGAHRHIDEDNAREVERRRRLLDQSVVYYVQMPGDVIKIGTTTNLRQRLTALRVAPDKVLATEPGDRRTERLRHVRFSADRVDPKREDFHPSKTLTEWIEGIRQKHGEPTITTYVKVPA